MGPTQCTRRRLLKSAGALLPIGAAAPALAVLARETSPRSVSIRAFGAKGDGYSDDTRAFQEAARALSSGSIDSLHIVGGRYRLTSGPFDVNRPAGKIAIHGDGPDATEIVLGPGAGQNAFIVRNTDYGTTVRGFTIRSDTVPSSYQHTLAFGNVSNLLVEEMSLEGAQGYGLGIFEDVLTLPVVGRACNNLVIRNNTIIDASQYGIQHFPKKRSRNAAFYGNRLVNCGRNTQSWIAPKEIIPCAMKVGQATAGTVVHDNVIVGANGAAAIDIANYEDIEVYRNSVTNADRHFVAISVGRHPMLLPWVSSHSRCVVRDNVFVHDRAGGRRLSPVLTFASEAETPVGYIEISRNRIKGDTLGEPASFDIKPGGVLRGLRLLENVWMDVPSTPAIIMLLSDAFGGRIIEPLIRGNEVYNRGTAQRTLRAVQLEGVRDAHIIGNHFVGMGENVLDLRNSSGRTLVKDNLIDGYNPTRVPGAVVVALTDNGEGEYEITGNEIRYDSGQLGRLVGGVRLGRVHASANRFEGPLR